MGQKMRKSRNHILIYLTIFISALAIIPIFGNAFWVPPGGGSTTYYAEGYHFYYSSHYWGSYYSGSLSDTRTNNGVSFVAKCYELSNGYICDLYLEFEDCNNADTLKVDFLFTADVYQDGDISNIIFVIYTTGNSDRHSNLDEGYHTFSIDDNRLVSAVLISVNEIYCSNPGNRYLEVDLSILET